jgi:hypothetical protein
MYIAPAEGERRYSPAECIGEKKFPVIGQPDPNRINTSHVERQNLTIRMHTRRLTRLTNAFSRKWTNLRAALALLHFAYYNFCRMRSSIRCTPAMAAGVTKSVWTLKDLLNSQRSNVWRKSVFTACRLVRAWNMHQPRQGLIKELGASHSPTSKFSLLLKNVRNKKTNR